MLVSIPPYMSAAQFVGTLKSKSVLMIFARHANLKYRYGSRNFWSRGYYVDTVRKNAKIIAEYIRNQLQPRGWLTAISYSKLRMAWQTFLQKNAMTSG